MLIRQTSITQIYSVLAAFGAISVVADVFLFRTPMMGLFNLLSAPPIFLVCIFLARKANMLERLWRAFLAGLIPCVVVIVSFLLGKLHDRAVVRAVLSVAEDIRQFKREHGTYPEMLSRVTKTDSATSNFIQIHGYPIRYIHSDYSAGAPYLLFDKFGYLQQTMAITSGVLSADKPQ